MATLAVARLTFANGLRQPLTWLVVAVGVALMAMSYLFGMFSFESSSRMRLLLTAGVASSMLCGLFLGVVSIAQVVHDELSSRTALTLFAKPISRHSFLLGKVLGVLAVVAVAVVLLILAHLAALGFAQQAGFDLSEQHRRHHQPSNVGFLPWGRTLLAHVLAFSSNVILICLAAALALKVPLAGTVIIAFAVFVGAHLLAASGFEGGLILPALQLFNIDDALHFVDVTISPAYFMLCLVHAALYGGACLAVGITVLQRQDIP